MSGKETRPCPDRATVRWRLQEATKLYVQGLATSTIENRLSLEWNVSHRTVRRYLRRVKDVIAYESRRAIGDEGRNRLRDELRLVYRRILSEALESGDLGNALKAAQQMARLDALERPVTEKVEVTHDIGPATPTDMLVDTLRAELKRHERPS